MRILSRYIVRELIAPTVLGFAFYTFIILMQQLLSLAEMIIKRSVPAGTVLKLLALSLPNIVVLTIPMSLLFGILIAIGRLSADSEIIAMRSAGLPTSAIYRPVFYFSLIVFGLNFLLMNWVTPRGNAKLQSLRAEQFAAPVIGGALKPRVFFDQYEGRVIYVNDIATDGTWRGVFVSDNTQPSQQRVIVAERGELSVVKHPRQLWLNLSNAETHVSNSTKPDRYDLNTNGVQRFLLIDRLTEDRFRISRSYREMTVRELMDELHHTPDPVDRRSIRVEIQKKFSIPFACLAFGIIGLPLGITNRRGGKSSGFSLSLAIILVYYIGITRGEDWATSGRIPPSLGMWLPNIVLAGVGIYLIRRANIDAGNEGGKPSRLAALQERIVAFFQRRPAHAGHDVEEERSLLSRLDIPFPNTFDRYVLREFLKILVGVLISTVILFLMVDYTQLARDISANHIPSHVAFAYYRYYSLQVLNWVLPLSVLLATLVTFGIFSRNNEVTAVKANGVSLYRLALPVIAVAGLVTVVSYLMLDFVLPYSNERMNELHSQIKGKETARAFSPNGQWVFGTGRYLFNFLSFDKDTNDLSQVQVFEFHPTRFKLTRRIYADSAHWDGSGWSFENGWMRSFSDDGTSSYSPFTKAIRLQYPEPPEYFANEVKQPNQMTYRELNRYVQMLQKSGYASDEFLVRLYQKTSEPFISLIMVLIALPFAFRVGKRGTLYGVGIALGLAFAYLTVNAAFVKFGEVGHLPALLAAWSANILFAIAAVYYFLRVET